jgi:4-hydroxybenzoate polyprenyltransferase
MSPLKPICSIFVDECKIFFEFSWRNWSVTIIPTVIFSIAAWRSTNMVFTAFLSTYAILVPWSILYIYSFELLSQTSNVQEDRINKPDRPIPSGHVTITGAKIRWAVVLAAFISIALLNPSILLETISWVIMSVFLSLPAAGHHWLGKNCIALSVGTWALLNPVWKLVTPATPGSTRFIYCLSAWASLGANIQDLRDIKGDMAIGRRTLPIVYGNKQSRFLLTFVLLPPALLSLWLGNIIQLAPITLCAAHVIVWWRVMQADRGPRYDHKTYMVRQSCSQFQSVRR